MSSHTVGPGTGAYTATPPLPQEMQKPPFRPGTAGKIGFFFGVVAGALVSAISLRRMGHPQKARKVIWITLLGAIALSAILLLVPDILGRLVGLGLEIVWYFIFPKIQDEEFQQWEATHREIAPSSGWKALGWGFIGTAVFLAIFFVMAILLLSDI
jgi:Na+/H+-dicarboxylate symporter